MPLIDDIGKSRTSASGLARVGEVKLSSGAPNILTRSGWRNRWYGSVTPSVALLYSKTSFFCMAPQLTVFHLASTIRGSFFYLRECCGDVAANTKALGTRLMVIESELNHHSLSVIVGHVLPVANTRLLYLVLLFDHTTKYKKLRRDQRVTLVRGIWKLTANFGKAGIWFLWLRSQRSVNELAGDTEGLGSER